jgi:hypothetical protein
MTLHDYLLKNLNSTVMIALSIDEIESYQYNYWNWFHQIGQLHLLKDDYSIGHIIHTGSIKDQNDNSVICESQYHPKQFKLDFYFGGVTL